MSIANLSAEVFVVMLSLISLRLTSAWKTSLETKSDDCMHKVYEGGDGTAHISNIPTIQAAVPSCAIIGALGGTTTNLGKNLPNAAKNILHRRHNIKGFTKALQTVAPDLASAMGLLGVGFSLFNQYTQVTPEDTMKETNMVFKKITDEANQRLDALNDYVDQQVLKVHKMLIATVYTGDKDQWVSSLKESSRMLVNQNQRNAESSLHAHRHAYMNLEKYKDAKGTKLSAVDVKNLEMQLFLLKKHVDLHLLALAALIETWKDGKRAGGIAQWLQYKRNFVSYGIEYVNYTRWAYKQIYDRRVAEQELEQKSYTCKYPDSDLHFSFTFSTFRFKYAKQNCSFSCNKFEQERKCDVSLLFDCNPSTCDGWEVKFEQILQDLIKSESKNICNQYLENLKTDVVNFWTREVLDYIPIWEEAVRMQQSDLQNYDTLAGRARDDLAENASLEQEEKQLEKSLTKGLTKNLSMLKYTKKFLENLNEIKRMEKRQQKKKAMKAKTATDM